MRSLVILVATAAVVNGLREVTPGFAADFRSFGESSIYQHQRLPHRQQARSFRETSPPSLLQLQNFREESFRDYRQPFGGRDEQKNFHQESRGGFKDDTRVFKEGNRVLEDELRNFNVDSRPFKHETRIYKDDVRSFGEERPFTDESRSINDDPRHFRDERPYRDEIRHYRDDIRTYRDDLRPYRDDIRHFEGPRPFRDEYRPFRDEIRPFREERPFKEESGPFRNEARPFRDERPFKEESGPFRNEPRPFRDDTPFKEESGPFRNEPRPFRDERPFKDELLFTDESQSLAEAQHRYNKEHQHRQPLSFGGHSSYLKYGNHGLGFASVPAAILPLEDNNTSQRAAGITISTAATPQSQEFSTSSIRESSSARESVDSKIQNSVTLPPDVRSTPSQSTSSNTIDTSPVGNHRNNENLFEGGSTSSASTAATISTSGGTNATPKVVFGSGSASVSSPSMEITSAVSGTGIQPTNTPSANSLQASKTALHVVGTPSSYYQSDDTSEIPAALLNYIFKYQTPDKIKTRYTFRQSLPTESLNHIPTVPLVHHHQPAKYTILPEFKIPEMSTIRQPGGTINFVSTAQLPKVSYHNENQPTLNLGTSYSNENIPSVNYARNLIQLDQGNQYSHYGQADLQQIGQSEHFPQFRQIATSGDHVSQFGGYGQFGQAEQTRNNPFGQGGLQLQLGGFSGIDYSALSGNSESTRGSQTLGLELGKVGLSLQEPPRTPVPTFPKITFGQSLW